MSSAGERCCCGEAGEVGERERREVEGGVRESERSYGGEKFVDAMHLFSARSRHVLEFSKPMSVG